MMFSKMIRLFFLIFCIVSIDSVRAEWVLDNGEGTPLSCVYTDMATCNWGLNYFKSSAGCSGCSITYDDSGDNCLVSCKVGWGPKNSYECITIVGKTQDGCLASIKNQKFLGKIKGTEYLARLKKKSKK